MHLMYNVVAAEPVWEARKKKREQEAEQRRLEKITFLIQADVRKNMTDKLATVGDIPRCPITFGRWVIGMSLPADWFCLLRGPDICRVVFTQRS